MKYYQLWRAFLVLCKHHQEGCEWVGKYGELQDHLNTDPQPEKRLEGCPLTTISCDFLHIGCPVKRPRKDMPGHLKENLVSHLSLMAFSHAKLETKCTKLEEECSMLKQENEQLKNDMKNIGGGAGVCVTDISARKKITIPPSNSPLVINNFQQYKRDGFCWYSPPMYSHYQGYKICIGVLARGEGNTKHISAFIYFMRGEFDDRLTWPFRGSISFQLLDQSGNQHRTHLCTYDDSVPLKNCERVQYGERANSGWGAPSLIAHSALKPHYLQ